ncbi:penicillin acylase family protein [Alicyclobacillus cycloheptanicus]|uniref:Penicillin amidase n=1 Tax=Alicyclobacillus cycloheptanicus TaxID=1457 RepID=A0ABT9XJ65_9BACL|nr:penicillin acylase family protein [Alicyclobacillus cycloheptanicus]MDQ0189766.1 penicillin amidase [Alicyclobacillus cycloheptanicus]WDM01970.1 penicillin acylase family protein [Alicyclobacillus cycloheptanicus]
MKKRSPAWKGVNLLAAAVVTAALVYAGAKGAGPLPPIGPGFNPGTGVWQMASDAQRPTTQTLHIDGLQQPVQVIFESNGVAHIEAKNDHDLYLAMGYLHAHFRLDQMDLMRRQGEGLLSQVVGKKALSSDEFELQLGLERTAEQEWQQMKPNDPARAALLAYSAGVNDCIAQDEKSGNLPALFKLLGYQPKTWTPVDSLVIQGDMTQSLDFSTSPLDYALLVKSLGYRQTMQFFPVLPADAQHPYDPGPYTSDGAAPMESLQTVSDAELQSVLSLQQRLRSLPADAIHQGSNSNNWAVDGTKTASGKPLMAGDPHLQQTLPAIWYQVAGDTPDTHFSGVSIPGVPIILIGHNQHISWSETNVQNQATLFYQEKTDKAHPNQYFWNGAWRPMKSVQYDIPVKGCPSVPLTVQLTVHGPIMTQEGQTLAVDWMGALPSPDLDVLLNVVHASNFAQFKSALKNWHAPSQNFVYADDKGNIGLISAGYYPIVKQGDPWLPLPGTGQSDVIGTIAYKDVPQSYDPSSHIVFSANQREVGPSYPYYIGTTMDFFDNGYRADEIYKVLSQGSNLTVQDMEHLQNSTTDYLATEIVPKLLSSLQGAKLTLPEQAAETALSKWNDQMDVNSTAASIWWTFWTQYLQDTFGPWWKADKVPVASDPSLAIGPNQAALDEDLEAWTLHDPTNSTFTAPGGAKRTAPVVMQQAFSEAVQQLSTKLGTNVANWQWGSLHDRAFEAVSQIPSLAYGPRPSGGDNWTVDAADSSDGFLSTAGPSWRFIMDWGDGEALGIYPGGQSENPMSPWYENFIQPWWNGQYAPMLSAQVAAGAPGHVTWTLQ